MIITSDIDTLVQLEFEYRKMATISTIRYAQNINVMFILICR